METTRTTSEALALLGATLDSIDHGQRRTVDHEERLSLVGGARAIAGRVQALLGVLVAEADAAKSSLVARGTPTSSWLSLDAATTAKEAAGLVLAGRDLTARPAIQQATLEGTIGVKQARAIAKVTAELPATLDETQRTAAERLLIEHAATTTADRLAQLGPRVLAEVCPAQAETVEGEARRLDLQTRRARAKRSLSFFDDGDGSMLIRGSLPVLDATRLVEMIGAYVESDRRAARDQRDPLAESRTPEQRRADALVALVAHHGAHPAAAGRNAPPAIPQAPSAGPPPTSPTATLPPLPTTSTALGHHGAAGHSAAAGDHAVGRRAPDTADDRPRIVVLMSEESLRARIEQAGILASGDKISPGDLRRLCCDADVTPTVLGTASEILDVGMTRRLVTPAMRKALSLRDDGCIFPGCDKPDAQCDAHHLRPWWDGKPTALHNLVSLPAPPRARRTTPVLEGRNMRPMDGPHGSRRTTRDHPTAPGGSDADSNALRPRQQAEAASRCHAAADRGTHQGPSG